MMLGFTFKMALKNLIRNKLTSIINVIGLSFSIACCILILFFIKYEISFDRFNHNSTRIYRFTYSVQNKNGYHSHFAMCASSWIKYLPNDFPEIEKMVTLMPFKNITLKVKEEKITLPISFYADSTFFNVFSIQLLQGDSNQVLSKPNNIVVSESFARKYFGNENPVGQTIANTGWNDGKSWTNLYYTITGVYRDIPVNSHFHSDLFISKSTIPRYNETDWKYVYLLLHRHVKPEDIIKNFPTFIKKHRDEEYYVQDIIPDLQCITDIHLKSDKDREIDENGNMMVIYIMGLVGLIILVISWINYLNLNIAGLYSRNKIINILKINGSPDRFIVFQSFIESLIIVFISFDLAIVLISLFFPAIKYITGNVLNDDMFQLAHQVFPWLFFMFGSSLVIGCIPALTFFIKRKSTIWIQKMNDVPSNKNSFSMFRKGLIIFQFTLTVILIISAFTISSQGRFVMEHQAGAKQDSVLVIKLFNQDILSKYTLLKSEILKSSLIKEATATFEAPYDLTMDAMGFETNDIKDENKDKILWVYSADDNYFKFLDIPIVAGADFPPFNENLKKEYYILNETAVKELGWTPEEAVGKPLKLKFEYDKNVFYGGQIVGVVKDFNLNTLHHPIKPYVFFQKEIWFWIMQVKIDMKHKQQAMMYLKTKWDELFPDYPFSYEYNTDVYFRYYKKEIVQSRLTEFFSFLAIIISCLGLFAISSVIILRRTKEIGIRKVNGAQTWEIMTLLIKDFTMWVVISIIIACPIAYYFMSQWLHNFVYKIGLSWWIFAIAGLVALSVALLTVCLQAWRTASRNPVEALRYE